MDKGATDVQSVFEEWLLRDQAENRTAPEVKRTFERYVLPGWGRRPIEGIRRRDVLDVIDAIADKGAIAMARRVQSRLNRLFVWSVGRGILTLNPMQGLPKPGSDIKRDRVLSDDELAGGVARSGATRLALWPCRSTLALDRRKTGRDRTASMVRGAGR